MKYLVVIGMQNDYVTGALKNEAAQAIVPGICNKIKEYNANKFPVFLVYDKRDDNYLSTYEGKHLPVPHCIEGTKGWEIREGLEVENATYINKNSFGYTGWGDFDLEEVELVGLCTDICVVSNALLIKAIYPEINVTVDSSCCAGVTPERHRAALDTMRSCQVNVI